MRFTARLTTPARLVDVVKAHLVVVPVGEIGGLIARGAVHLAERVGRMAELVRDGDVLAVDATDIAPLALPPDDAALAIRYEDDELVICSKPAALHVHPLGRFREGTLLNRMLWHVGARANQPWASARPSPLHRLDRAASGLVAFAKSAAAHDAFRRLLAEHQIERRYTAMVIGHVHGDAGTIDAPLGRDPTLDYRRAVVPIADGGQHAVTQWTVLARHADRTLLEVTLETGRTHQIRAHLASIGHPIVGDQLYIDGGEPAPAIALHATRLAFRHPHSGAEVVCTDQSASV